MSATAGGREAWQSARNRKIMVCCSVAGGHAICTGAKGAQNRPNPSEVGGRESPGSCASARVTPGGLKMSGARRGRRGGR